MRAYCLCIALEGNVNIVNTKWYTDMPVLTPSFVNPKSTARLSDIALANMIMISVRFRAAPAMISKL